MIAKLGIFFILEAILNLLVSIVIFRIDVEIQGHCDLKNYFYDLQQENCFDKYV